ncbi:hypothetical protein CVT24_012293, partial [Panaeolus cyanescens]
LRIGGVLEFLLRGIPFDVVKELGRWSSNAFSIYLRKHAAILAPYIQDVPVLEPFTRVAMPAASAVSESVRPERKVYAMSQRGDREFSLSSHHVTHLDLRSAGRRGSKLVYNSFRIYPPTVPFRCRLVHTLPLDALGLSSTFSEAQTPPARVPPAPVLAHSVYRAGKAPEIQRPSFLKGRTRFSSGLAPYVTQEEEAYESIPEVSICTGVVFPVLYWQDEVCIFNDTPDPSYDHEDLLPHSHRNLG